MTYSNHFPKTKRILKRDEFKFRGKIFTTSLCKFVFKENSHPSSRLGLIVTKRYSKSAVKRNRIKRIIREEFRISSILKSENLDIVAIVSRKINLLSELEINKLVKSNWNNFEENL